jgi:hypothetical protein
MQKYSLFIYSADLCIGSKIYNALKILIDMLELKDLEGLAKDYIYKDFRGYNAATQQFLSGMFNSIISKDPDNFIGHYGLGALAMLKENELDAIRHFNKCLSRPKDELMPTVHMNLGLLYVMRQDYANASTQYSAALCFRKIELEDSIDDLALRIVNDQSPLPEKAEINGLTYNFIMDEIVKEQMKQDFKKIIEIKQQELSFVKTIEKTMEDFKKADYHQEACEVFQKYEDKYLS